MAKNRTIHWHPEHIGEGRFGNWLENVVDWALSRRRYWGTPLPIWRCDECRHLKVIGSYEELFTVSGTGQAGGPLRRGAVQSAPAVHRRDHLALRRVRQGDDAAGGGGDRRLVRLGRHALRPASLSVREPRADRRPQAVPGRLTSPRPWTRRAAGSTPCTCWRCCCSIRSPTRTASCSATSTTSRGGRCRSGSATSSSRWR